jgi:hypothetical protein
VIFKHVADILEVLAASTFRVGEFRKGRREGIEAASDLVGQWPRRIVQKALSWALECHQFK